MASRNKRLQVRLSDQELENLLILQDFLGKEKSKIIRELVDKEFDRYFERIDGVINPKIQFDD